MLAIEDVGIWKSDIVGFLEDGVKIETYPISFIDSFTCSLIQSLIFCLVSLGFWLLIFQWVYMSIFREARAIRFLIPKSIFLLELHTLTKVTNWGKISKEMQ